MFPGADKNIAIVIRDELICFGPVAQRIHGAIYYLSSMICSLGILMWKSAERGAALLRPFKIICYINDQGRVLKTNGRKHSCSVGGDI